MTSIEFDDFPLATWSRGRRRTRREPVCDHSTCPGCAKCDCHRKPKKPILEPLTETEARAVAAQLRLGAMRAMRLLDAITSTSKKIRPISHLEEAVARGHADLDNTLRSPSLNGAVSGGDDPSWRTLDQIGITPEKRTEAGELLSGGNLRERYDTTTAHLETLVGAIEQIERSAGFISGVIDELRAIPPDEAKRLLEADSDVQHCVNCGKVVTGTEGDWLRGGRCSTCNQYKREHDGRDRPKSLIEKEVEREIAASATSSANDCKFSSESEDCAPSALPDRQ